MVAELRNCFRPDLDCTDLCLSTGRISSRHTGYDAYITRAALQACMAACKACGDECASHADTHDHCRISADACRAREQACQKLLGTSG